MYRSYFTYNTMYIKHFTIDNRPNVYKKKRIENSTVLNNIGTNVCRKHHENKLY